MKVKVDVVPPGCSATVGPMTASVDDVRWAAEVLRERGRLLRTPVVEAPDLGDEASCRIFLKLENLQVTGSFKARGAFVWAAAQPEGARARGLVTASAGNHGLGVARAARILDDRAATVFVPRTTPATKLAKLASLGADVHIEGASYEDAARLAASWAADHGALLVPAYDDDTVIAGQGTVGLELVEDLPETDVILVPVGGGALSAGIAVAAKALRPQVEVWGVQPDSTPAAWHSFHDGRCRESWDAAPSIADGLTGGYGLVPFQVARELLAGIVVVRERALADAVFALLDRCGQVVEGSGAAAVAPLLDGPAPGYDGGPDLAGRTVACVLSGGNIDTTLLHRIMTERL